MTTTEYPLVLTASSLEGGNDDVVDANVDIVNRMYLELLGDEEIAENALASYYVDFYLTQALAGGFAQYVFMVTERGEVDAYVRAGLERMGATAHLDLFNRTCAAFDALSVEEAEIYLDGELDESEESPEAVALLDELDGEFETLLETEDIVSLNAAWLRGQENLLVLNDAEVQEHIASRVAQIPNLEERKAQAEALANAPEFEVIIRELCSIAGYELQKITMGDPNFEHNGVTTLAWHFATDHGDYIMVEDDDEAFMLHPETKEIIAAVEFQEA